MSPLFKVEVFKLKTKIVLLVFFTLEEILKELIFKRYCYCSVTLSVISCDKISNQGQILNCVQKLC